LLLGYVVYYLQSANLGILDKSTAIPSLSRDDLYAQNIPLAPLPEQHRIVDAIETQFTRLDAAVAALQRVKANLARYKASVLKAACEGRLVPTEAELHRRGGAFRAISPNTTDTGTAQPAGQPNPADGECLALLPAQPRPTGEGEAFLPSPGTADMGADMNAPGQQRPSGECLAPTPQRDIAGEYPTPPSTGAANMQSPDQSRINRRGGASPESPTDTPASANAHASQSQTTTAGCLALPQQQRPDGEEGEAFLQRPGVTMGVGDARVEAGQGPGAECPAPTQHDVDGEYPTPAAYEPADVLLRRILAERRARWEAENPGKRYKEPQEPDTSDLPELPGGWCWASVEQVADVGTGATPLRSKRVIYYKNGTIPWVTSGALNDLFVDEATEFITELALQETNAKLFPAGSLLVAMYGEGKTRGKVSELRLDAATNQACAALLFDGEAQNCKPFVKIFFRKNYDDIRRLSSGGVQPNLNLSIIRGTSVPLPPLAEQHRIVAEVERRLSVVAEVEAAVDANLARAERLRQAILKRAFEGRLVPQDPDDEPASALLERIKAQSHDR